VESNGVLQALASHAEELLAADDAQDISQHHESTITNAIPTRVGPALSEERLRVFLSSSVGTVKVGIRNTWRWPSAPEMNPTRAVFSDAESARLFALARRIATGGYVVVPFLSSSWLRASFPLKPSVNSFKRSFATRTR